MARPRRAAPIVSLVVVLLAACSVALADRERRDLLRFAAEMAEKGNWREARFRWERASAQAPDDPRLLNNLAVAKEALGEPAGAMELYARALSLSGGQGAIAENAARAARFWRGTVEQPAALPAEPTREGSRRARSSDTLRVAVELPMPARLDLADVKTLLVASFLARETELMDSGREVARFLRTEFRKRSALDVLEVTPPPAVPEQILEDLVANREFWQHLGREHGADLVVSGQIRYDRRDASGFQEVEEVSPVTGHKVRRTKFVEQEQFTYAIDVVFFDGRTGEPRFRDHLERSAVYQGQSNDPITAFYQISESIADDVLAVVAPRVREDERILFRS